MSIQRLSLSNRFNFGEEDTSAMHTIYSRQADYMAADRHAPRRVSLIEIVLRTITKMEERRSSRRALMAMTDDQLKDIGISRADAEREGLRNPWE